MKSPKILGLVAVVLLAFVADLLIGNVYIPFDEVLKALVGMKVSNIVWTDILYEFRLPRAITAVLTGAGLGISGLLMQTLFRNPLAGPFVLGISSGASLGVALFVLAGTTIGGILGIQIANWGLVVAAGIGSLVVFLVVLALSIRIRESVALLIVGIMMASVTSALVGLLQYFSTAERIQVFLIWTFGSLGGVSWSELALMVPIVFIGIVVAWLQFKPLNMLLLGENYAQSMGLHIRNTRLWIILVTCLLAGTITAFCGPIAFIGLAVPHLARMYFQTSNHKLLVPFTALSGIILLLLCDIISQLPGRAEVIPINLVTSTVGAPLVIWIILGRKFRKQGVV